MEKMLAEWRMPIAEPRNSEEVIVSQVGWPLYERFFQHYTEKQWRRHPRDLDASVCGRIPVRTNRDDRFVTERFQALPSPGYTAMFERMLAHPKIEVRLKTAFAEARQELSYRHLIYTGPIDAYFDHRLGALPYRSLRFEPETFTDREFYQPAMQVNYPNDFDFTRIVEIKHATGQKIAATTIVREYPEDFGPGKEPYYPIPAPDTRALYEKYAALAEQEKNVSFVGRLATYRYYNMDQVVGMALAEFEKLTRP
jgi:UDP-galactopyranose mutase